LTERSKNRLRQVYHVFRARRRVGAILRASKESRGRGEGTQLSGTGFPLNLTQEQEARTRFAVFAAAPGAMELWSSAKGAMDKDTELCGTKRRGSAFVAHRAHSPLVSNNGPKGEASDVVQETRIAIDEQ